MPKTLPDLRKMKQDGQKIVGIVVYDYQTAQIADRAGADVISLGDSVGHNILGQRGQEEVTLDQVVMFARAVRGGVKDALFNCDMPFGSYQTGEEEAVRSAIRMVKEGGVDCVKIEVTRPQANIVAAIARAGIPVFAQFGLTPTTSAQLGGWDSGAKLPVEDMVETAKILEQAGASMLDVTHAGEATGPVTRAVSIPVLCGVGNDGNSDGQIRTLFRMAGQAAASVDDEYPRYGSVAREYFETITAYAADIRAGKLPNGYPSGRRPS
ncbi:MAG TPA: 3-methyl-2-oxobutanoate hydroxymethyltransferase [Chloroflexota bacterium]|nr:3-methyl-2-oxobutanoate hydroxymethyltransferase [Chloroflexota bacterium]